MSKYLSEIEERALNEFKDKLIQEYSTWVKLVILYGSKVRGNFNQDSDIDVLIIIKKKDISLSREVVGLAFDMMLKYGSYISVKTIDEKRFNELLSFGSDFIKNVLDEGEVIYDRREGKKNKSVFREK